MPPFSESIRLDEDSRLSQEIFEMEQNFKEQLNITEDSDDLLPDSPIIDMDVNEDEEEYSTSDEENEENTV